MNINYSSDGMYIEEFLYLIFLHDKRKGAFYDYHSPSPYNYKEHFLRIT